MTVVPFPSHPPDPPVLMLPIAAVTFDGTSHHQHPAVSDLTLCMVPIGPDAAWGNPAGRTRVEPITCTVCAAAVEEAVDTLAMPDICTPEQVARVLRCRAGGLLAAAHTLHPIEVPE